MWILISRFLQKPADFCLHCFHWFMSAFILFLKEFIHILFKLSKGWLRFFRLVHYLFFNMEQVKLINGQVPLGNLLGLRQVSTFAILTPLLLYRNATMIDQSMAPQGRDTKQRQPHNSKNQNVSMIRKYQNHTLQTNPWRSHRTLRPLSGRRGYVHFSYF